MEIQLFTLRLAARTGCDERILREGVRLEDDGPAEMIDTGSKEGIQGHVAALGHEPHQFTHFYVQVDDVAVALEKVKTLGGTVVVPPVPIPTGTFAWFADPEGNTVGLWKPK